ncbi:MAG TPA: hypothetical protein VLN45_02195, partial [Ignavibacteriaceae bacterium]|nr:hypothetical protein [Ignavibacteriaceae bacterium]
MQKLFTFLFISFFLASPLIIAQEQIAAAKPENGDERCWGMNFMWQKDFTVGKQVIDRFNYNPNTTEDESVTGFGLDWYLNPKSSVNLIGSVGISSDETENTGGKTEFSATEFGIKAGWNFYPYKMDKPVYFSLGPWVSFVSYSDETTFTPETGDPSSNEYSASRLGFGVNATAYLKPWEDLNFEFLAGYNLGAFITPESTNTVTAAGQ